MKCSKKIISLIIAIAFAANFLILSNVKVLAHESLLDVEYDNCTPPELGSGTQDSIDEMWYVLFDEEPSCYHISHNEMIIKYYFSDVSQDGTYTWTTDVSNTIAQEIKDAYVSSMKKWNNIYFYSYNIYGTLEKHKIITIIEGTCDDHNLTIYPTHEQFNYAVNTQTDSSRELIGGPSSKHYHYSKWAMNVDIDDFYSVTDDDTVQATRERTGAHEIGHILGLRDIYKNELCHSNAIYDHHKEVIMGDFSPTSALDITYQDIAGVAITRGFHTDNDHKWLNCGLQSDGTYKILCSICNGVRYVSSLSGYTYDNYNACNGIHNLSSGNMMAVASYGTCDYYKCKYCRYVAPFSSIVPQNYIKTSYSDSLHQCSNSVDGLEYNFYESHTFVNNYCTGCGAHNHTYRMYMYYDNKSHRGTCSCGSYELEAHYVKYSDIVDGRYANCLGCLRRLDLNSDVAGIIRSGNTVITENGSYILPSGIIVLADADVEAYINGTLEINIPDN